LRTALDQAFAEPGPSFIAARVGMQATGLKPPRKAAVTTYRFMRAIGTLPPEPDLTWD
jgi:hypothetical protein